MQVGLHYTQGEDVSVQYVSLVESGSNGPTALDLRDALPLEELLAPVSACKERISQAVDLLRPDSPAPTEASLDAVPATPPQTTRGFGGALQVSAVESACAPSSPQPMFTAD